MSASCSGGCATDKPPVDPRFRRILIIALVLNAAMFAIELGGSWSAGSASLLADAADFLGDSVNYAVSLYVLALAAVWRSRTALAKGLAMGLYGLGVVVMVAWHLLEGTVPAAGTMGLIGLLALAVNAGVAFLLYAYRTGDANMRAVWLCSRNDAIGNVAVMLAAAGVFGTGRGWPDLVVAVIMGGMALTSSRTVISHALAELRAGGPQGAHAHRDHSH